MLFKKKTDNKIIAAEAVAAQLSENIEKNTTVYTMPKRFLGKKPDANKAKTTGVVILLLGFIFLLAAIIFLYVYFVKKPFQAKINMPANNGISTETQNVNTVNNQVINTPIQPSAATNTTQPSLVIDENSEQAVATSTINDEDIDVAASSTESTDLLGIIDTNTITTVMPMAAPDSDSDGLTDPEESIFGTDQNKKDSDDDGYEDLAEIKSGYNPAGQGKLLVNSSFDVYSNPTYSYTLYYPKIWSTNDGAGDNSIVFLIDDKQFIQVIVQDNAEAQTIEDWYKSQFNVSFIPSAQTVYKTNWTGVKNENGLVVYLSNPLGTKIYTLSYQIGDNNIADFKNIFDLMIDSLKD